MVLIDLIRRTVNTFIIMVAETCWKGGSYKTQKDTGYNFNMDPRPLRMGFVVDDVALGHVSLRVLFLLSVSVA